jgi:dipeptidyl aminopeptidase/acylaminoacyl peptidase
MGEVYRATDTTLNREVAIKVLPPEVVQDAERLARFRREAQVLASLNHPNIAAIYGLEEAEGKPFIALELVEGEDLKERLARGAIPVGEALEIAKQIAEGLEEAHEKGIVHRDLKPANVKVTPDGKVKILDFGLAKAWSGDGAGGTSSADLSQSPTLAHTGTAAGIILGTAAYMSPEQARGKPVDKRADVWAFGVVLWEMLTGRRLFEGETVSDVLAAVLKNEPDWGALPKNVGPATRRLLARCLEKNPGRRYRDIGDVAFDLDAGPAADAQRSTMPSGAARTTGRLAWATAGLAVAVAIGLGTLLWRQHSARPSPPQFEKLTFAPLFITNARFAPDGRTVVFSAAREGNTSELFVRHPEDPQPRQLGGANVQLLSVSSKGELAVLTGTRFRSHRSYVGTLARMPLAEASPREVLNDVSGADWSPDGTELAIIRQVSGRSRLEYPIGTVLAEATGYISDVRVSPGGDLVAFMPHTFEWDDRGPVVVVDRKGAVVAKSPEYWGVEGVAWSADGATVLFAATDPPAPYAVRELALDGTVRNVLNGPTGLVICDRTPDGRLLVSTYTFTNVLSALFPDAGAERELPWLEASVVPVLSRDGRRLLFTDQSPLAGLDFSTYLRPTDGSPPVRLGEGMGVDLSPDGASVLVGIMSDPPRLMIYPTGAGEPRDISAAGFVSYDFKLARFLANGQGVAFCGAEAGKASRCYVRDLAGGAARAVTPEGTDHGLVSPDGSAVVARGTDGRYQLYPLDGSEPVPVPGLDDEDYPITWRQDGRSLLVYRPMEIPTRVERLDLSTGQRTLVRELAPVDRVGANAVYGVSFSADEKSYAYAFERILGALYSVEGVR